MKKVKTIDVVKKWLKDNCVKGQLVRIESSSTTLVMMKQPLDFVFSYKVNTNNPKKKINLMEM